MNTTNELFDVVSVEQNTNSVRMIAERKTQKNAEAIEMMAVYRQGVEDAFFATVPHGKYKDGDKWNG